MDMLIPTMTSSGSPRSCVSHTVQVVMKTAESQNATIVTGSDHDSIVIGHDRQSREDVVTTSLLLSPSPPALRTRNNAHTGCVRYCLQVMHSLDSWLDIRSRRSSWTPRNRK